MPRQLAPLALALAAAACAPDATAPAAPRESAPRPLVFAAFLSYQPTVLPLRTAKAINGSGAVVGTVANEQGAHHAQGVTTILSVPLGHTRVVPVDLLDDGRILAKGEGPQGSTALLYASAATASPLAIAGRFGTTATAMNNQGVAVGTSFLTGQRAFRWTAATGAVDITPAGCESSSVLDISETGFVLGRVGCGGVSDVIVWSPGSSSGVALPRDFFPIQALSDGSVLGRFPGIGSAVWSQWSGVTGAGQNPSAFPVRKVSPNGRYVGTFVDAATGRTRAWTSIGTGAPVTLPLPAGFASTFAVDVNACGTILGGGQLASDGSSHVIVWSRGMTCEVSGVSTAGAF